MTERDQSSPTPVRANVLPVHPAADFPDIPDFLDRRNGAAQATCRITTTPDVIEFHPLAAMFPLTKGEEFDCLVEDIRAHGLREPIVVHEDKILDGRNRYRACVMADVACRFEAYAGDDPRAFVISMNLHRRHLTFEQKREWIARLRKENPEKSNRQIAEMVKASPTTVGTVTAKLEAEGDVSKLDTRTDTLGRKQPVTKPRKAKDWRESKTADGQAWRTIDMIDRAVSMIEESLAFDQLSNRREGFKSQLQDLADRILRVAERVGGAS